MLTIVYIYTTNNKISCLGFIILHIKIFSHNFLFFLFFLYKIEILF